MWYLHHTVTLLFYRCIADRIKTLLDLGIKLGVIHHWIQIIKWEEDIEQGIVSMMAPFSVISAIKKPYWSKGRHPVMLCPCLPTVKNCGFGQAWLPLDEAMLFPPIIILVLHVPGTGFQVSCSIAFLGTEVRLSNRLFPESCFLPLKKGLI